MNSKLRKRTKYNRQSCLFLFTPSSLCDSIEWSVYGWFSTASFLSLHHYNTLTHWVCMCTCVCVRPAPVCWMCNKHFIFYFHHIFLAFAAHTITFTTRADRQAKTYKFAYIHKQQIRTNNYGVYGFLLWRHLFVLYTKWIRISKMKCLRIRIWLSVYRTKSKVIKLKQNYVIFCERSNTIFFYCFEEEEEKVTVKWRTKTIQ